MQQIRHLQTQQLRKIPHRSTQHRATTPLTKPMLLQVEPIAPSPPIQQLQAIRQLLTALRQTKPTRATPRQATQLRLLIPRRVIVRL